MSDFIAVDFTQLGGIEAGDDFRVTVLPGDIDAVNALISLNTRGIIGLSGNEVTFLLTVSATGDWEGDDNRNLKLVAASNWDAATFEREMAGHLEALATGRGDRGHTPLKLINFDNLNRVLMGDRITICFVPVGYQYLGRLFELNNEGVIQLPVDGLTALSVARDEQHWPSDDPASRTFTVTLGPCWDPWELEEVLQGYIEVLTITMG